jgi:hypothetical protein
MGGALLIDMLGDQVGHTDSGNEKERARIAISGEMMMPRRKDQFRRRIPGRQQRSAEATVIAVSRCRA